MIENLYNKVWLSVDEYSKKIISKQSYITPDHIEEISGIIYGNEDDQFFDMYYPKNMSDKKLPVIVYIHGGAYIGGVQKVYCEYCRMLADKGYCVINMDYVKGLKRGFPSPVFDFFKFYNFIEKNPEISKHIDFDNFIFSGDSAGGHITSLITNIQLNPEIKKEFGVDGGPNVKGCILFSPMLGIYKFNGLWPKEEFAKIVYKEFYNNIYKNIDHTIENVTKDFPPSIIISVKSDILKLHAYMFEKKAREIGLSLEHYCITTGKHLMHSTPVAYPHDKENEVAISKIVTFIDKVVHNKTERKVKYEIINKMSIKDCELLQPTLKKETKKQVQEETLNY